MRMAKRTKLAEARTSSAISDLRYATRDWCETSALSATFTFISSCPSVRLRMTMTTNERCPHPARLSIRGILLDTVCRGCNNPSLPSSSSTSLGCNVGLDPAGSLPRVHTNIRQFPCLRLRLQTQRATYRVTEQQASSL